MADFESMSDDQREALELAMLRVQTTMNYYLALYCNSITPDPAGLEKVGEKHG